MYHARLERPVRAAEFSLRGWLDPLHLVHQPAVVGPAVHGGGGLLLDTVSMDQVVVFIVLVGTHLVDAVDAVPHSSVEICPLIRGETVASISLDTGDKLGPGLGEEDIADMVDILGVGGEDVARVL